MAFVGSRKFMPSPVVRNLTFDFAANALRRELRIPIYTTRQATLIDIKVVFRCEPSLSLTAPGDFRSATDLRIYIGDQNVTASFIQELKSLLLAAGIDSSAGKYLDAAVTFGKFSKQLDLGAQGFSHTDEQSLRTALSTGIFLDKLNLLGDGTMFHPVNFLYTSIPLQPISLARVWDAHQHLQGLANVKLLAELAPMVLTISQGPSPSIEVWDAKAVVPAGQTHVNLELSLKNPIDEALVEVANRLDLLGQQLETVRVDYLSPTASTVDVLGHDLHIGNDALKDNIDALGKLIRKLPAIPGTGTTNPVNG
jgi:hypothetical protein